MARQGNTCRAPNCSKQFHYCGSCGEPRWNGLYCSEECFKVGHADDFKAFLERHELSLKQYRLLIDDDDEIYQSLAYILAPSLVEAVGDEVI